MGTGDGSLASSEAWLFRLKHSWLEGACSAGLEGGEGSGHGFGCGQGVAGFFDDVGWGSGVRALGKFVGGEEFGVAVGAVAGTEEVEKALLGDGDLFGWRGLL